jgi:hypothetical protein
VNQNKLDSPPPSQSQGALPIWRCTCCGGAMAIVRTMLNSTTGKTIRMFECTCGERAWSEDR